MPKYLVLLFAFCACLIIAGEQEREEDVYSTLSGDFAASHILIQYRRAEKAPAEMERSKKDAEEKAEKLLAQLQADPTLFEELARRESDGPTAVKGGYLGSFNRGDMAPKFEAMVRKLEEGELAPSVVKTGFGYHIIRRESMKQRNYGVGAILVVHRGANRLNSLKEKNDIYERTGQQAQEIIQKAAKALETQDFASVAASFGDLESSEGFFGIFRKGEGPLSDSLVEQVAPLELGAVGKVIELPVGYAILQRRAAIRYQASRIWIAHRDSPTAVKEKNRSREEAQVLAQDLMKQINANPSEFESLAKAHSAGPFSSRGGVMAPWYKGLVDEAFQAIVSGLEIGEMTAEPVETPDGFFIVKRLY